MSRGRRTVPRSSNGTPKRRQYTPKTASTAATRMSHQSASSRPPATAWPSTAAITGLLRSIRVGPRGARPSSLSFLRSPPAIALRSAPAQKVPPAPVSTATFNASSRSYAWNARVKDSAVGISTALRTSGRLIVTMATSRSRSTVTVLMLALTETGFVPVPQLPLQGSPINSEPPRRRSQVSIYAVEHALNMAPLDFLQCQRQLIDQDRYSARAQVFGQIVDVNRRPR